MKAITDNNFGLMRLILATLVALGHVKSLSHPAPPYAMLAYVNFWVDAFFVISGFCVYGSFDKLTSPGSFYIKRIFRIYPLYIVTILAQGLAMAIVAGGIAEHGGELLRYLGFNLLLANFLAHDLGGLLDGLPNPGVNPSLWTLKVEAGFYLILPLLWHVLRRTGLWFLALLYLASSVYTLAALDYGSHTFAKQLPGQLRFFIIGIALYHYRDVLTISTRSAAAAALLLLAACMMLDDVLLVFVYPLCIGLLVFICAMRLPAVSLPVDISYGVYLFHGPLIQFSLLLGFFDYSAGFILSLLAVLYALAFAAERFIERPGIALGKRLSETWLRRRAATARQAS